MYKKEYVHKRIYDLYKIVDNMLKEFYGEIPYESYKDLRIILQDIIDFECSLSAEGSYEWKESKGEDEK